MVVKTTTTFGNFAIQAQAEITNEQQAILANAGFLQELQRSPASAAEKAMAGYDKRPAGFKRNSIEYSEEQAAKLLAELTKPITIAEGVTITPTVEISEHIPGQGTEPKHAAAKALYAKKDHAKLAALIEFEGETEMDGDELPMAFIEAITAWLKSDSI